MNDLNKKSAPKLIHLGEVRALVNQLVNAEITMSRFTEILNQKAEKITYQNAELLEACKIALHTLDCIDFTREQGTASNRLYNAIKKATE